MRVALGAFLLLFSVLAVGLLVAGARVVRENRSELARFVTSWRFVAYVVALAAFTYSQDWDPWISPTMFLLLVPIGIAHGLYAQSAQRGTERPSVERPPSGNRPVQAQIAVPTGAEPIDGFKMLVGYVRGVDRLPAICRANGLVHRIAFIQETYRPDLGPDSYFDARLWEGIVRLSAQLTSLETAQVRDPDLKKTMKLRDVTELLAAVRERARTLDEPFLEIQGFHSGRLVVVLQCDFWVHLGGPDAYHDSYTHAVFTEGDLFSEIKRAADELASQLGLERPGVVQAVAAPPRESLVERAQRAAGKLASLVLPRMRAERGE
ncbi:MAG: hypothetical protein WBC51_18245 [Vicinamibacterales bacterium]